MVNNAYFIKAHARGMIYPEYVWISYGWYTEKWWLEEDTDCTTDQMQNAIQHSLAIHHFPTPMSEEENAPTDVVYVSNSSMHHKHMLNDIIEINSNIYYVMLFINYY